MGVIVPAILPQTKHELYEQLERLAAIHNGVNAVQIDVMDGRFAAPENWPYNDAGGEFARMVSAGELLPHAGRFKYDIDLMVTNPEQATGPWLALGASRITVHAESTSYLPRVIADLKHRYGHDRDFVPDLISFGLATNVGSELALIEPYVNDIDYVQFTGTATAGKSGQPFDERVLKKIETFRKRCPAMTIQVDGGVSLRTAPRLLAAGVDRLVAPIALFSAGDAGAEYRKFEALGERYGTYE